MQSSPSASDHSSSTKAALDHLQFLIEQLLRENRHLKLSLQQTRSQLDEVRAHLNRFKIQVSEHEKNDHVVRKQIRAMATLIERRRDGNSPPSSPEACPAPPPSSISKSSPLPDPALPAILPSSVANSSDLAFMSPTATIRDTPPLPDVNGNCSGSASANDTDTVSCTPSPRARTENEQQSDDSSQHIRSQDFTSNSRSPPKRTLSEKVSSPSTSVSDALQKAFVAMENDTTNAVQVLHDTKHMVSLETVSGGNHHVEEVSHLSLVKDTKRDISSREANGIQRDGPQYDMKKQAASFQKRSVKQPKRRVAGTRPASDTGIPASANRSAMKSANGRLTRSLTQLQSRSPSQSASHLAKSVALKKTKKGYKVSLALSRNSSKSGDSSSSSSDSDCSGPGCSASIIRPMGQHAKAQVSLEAGLPALINAARKLKENIGNRKKNDRVSDDESQDDSESGKETEERVGNSSPPGLTRIRGNGIESASLSTPSTRTAYNGATPYATTRSEDGHDSLRYATGSPKVEGCKRELKDRIPGAVTVNEKLINDRKTWQRDRQSTPFTYGSTSHMEDLQCTPSPHTPDCESTARKTSLAPDHFSIQNPNGVHPRALENQSQATTSASRGSTQDSDDQSLAAGKATKSDLGDNSEDAEMVAIRELTHEPVRPRSFIGDENGDTADLSSTVKPPSRGTTEFLTIRSGSSEMLSWKARPGSKFVDVAKGALAVKYPASIALEEGKIVMNGKMRVLKPITMDSNNKEYCYVSPVYPDGTFLPYVPVSGVVLHGKPVRWDSSKYADQSVQLSFSKEVFDTLVSHARRAYRKRYPGAHVSFPGAFLAGHRVRKVVKIEPECSVNMTRLHREPSKCSVAETLTMVKKDVVGLVLLYLSIEARSEDRLSVEVKFGLHSMVAHRLCVDRRR